MIIGVPKEIKDGERRVALTPDGARASVERGIPVLVEAGAGRASGFDDDEYVAVGASLVPRQTVYDEADLIVKVKEPIADESAMLRPGQVLFCYLHLAVAPQLTRSLLERCVTAIAYEHVQLADGSLPLLTPMSTISGRLAVVIGATYLESNHGGRGVLVSGLPGVPPATIVVLGCGVVGTNAVRIALGLEARVLAVDASLSALARLDAAFPGRIQTIASTPTAVGRAVREADLVIGAALVPGARAPKLVTEEMVGLMLPGSVIVDIAIDQGGCVETSRPTSHDQPTFVSHGVIHYAVPNVPALVPRSATIALSNATLPYVLALSQHGLAALDRDAALARGVVTHEGRLTSRILAGELGLPFGGLPSTELEASLTR